MRLRSILDKVLHATALPKKEEHAKREQFVIFPATDVLIRVSIAQIIFDCCKGDLYEPTSGGKLIIRGENPSMSMVGKKINDFDYDVEIRKTDEKSRLCVRIKEKGSTKEGYSYWISLNGLNRGAVVNSLGWSHGHYRSLTRNQVEFLVKKFITSENPRIEDYEITPAINPVIFFPNLSLIPEDSSKPSYIRNMIREDLSKVLKIEKRSCDDYNYSPWFEEDFLRCLRQKNCIGMVAEQGEKVIGFMIYELHKTRLHILNFAVHPKYRRCGIGTQMVEKLVNEIFRKQPDPAWQEWNHLNRISINVRETGLDTRLFFHTVGFRGIGISREFYPDTGEDAYIMEYRFGELVEKNEVEKSPRIKIYRLAS